MRNIWKLLCFCAFLFVTTESSAVFVVWPDETVSLEITNMTPLENLDIINQGTISGLDVGGGIEITLQNYGLINGEIILRCNEFGVCAHVTQVITGVVDTELGVDDMNQIPNLSGHTVFVSNGDSEISLVDIIAVAGDADKIVLGRPGVIIDVGAIEEHPNIELNSGGTGTWANSASFIIRGLDESWNETEPILTGIEMPLNYHGSEFLGVDSMFNPSAELTGGNLYVHFARQTNYGMVFENDLGNWLDELRDDDPDDKLLDALDAARTRAELRNILSRSMRTNPIKLMDLVRSVNTFVLGEHVHDLAFGIVAEPFYVYSSDFSVLGGGAGVSGRIAKNLVAKFGVYVGKMNYDGDLDDFSGMIYGANFGALYKDSDFYARAIGTVSAAQFKDIEVFDGTHGAQNPNGIAGAGMVDGGLVFRLFDEFDLTPFVGARFDYAHVLKFTDTDVNLRFGLNVDKETIVDGNKYAFGVQAVGQTNGEIYGAIYTDIMSVVDGVGGRLQFGFLNDDFGMSYKIALDAKFAF